MLKKNQITKTAALFLLSCAASTFAAAEYFYSLLDSKGNVLVSEDKMPVGKTYNCGGIDLTDPLKPGLDLGKMCDLADGEYFLQLRSVNGGEEKVQKFDFKVTSTKYYFSLLDSKGNVVMGEDKMLAGGKYYCGIDLSNPKSISVNKSALCDLDDGDYILQSRTTNGDKDNVQKFEFSVSSASTDTEYFYSLLDSKGKTVMGEDKMLVGKTYYCGGIDLTDALAPKVDPNKICDLAEGDYTLKFRSKTGDKESTQNFNISVASTKYYFSLLDSKGKVLMDEDKMLAGDKYYCGGIDLTDATKPVFDLNSVCDLADGEYVLQERVQRGEQEKTEKFSFTVTSTKYYFSLLDSKGKTVMGEDKMLAGQKYYCDGIDLTDPLNIKVNTNIMCELEGGDYVLQSRVQNGNQEKKQEYKFSLIITKVYYSVLDSKGKTVLGEDEMLAGAKYFCAIDLTDPANISIEAEFCNIEKGDYVFQRRQTTTGKDDAIEQYKFEVAVVTTSLSGLSLRTPVAKLSVSGRIMQMSLENARADYSVMDLQGRVIAKGVLQSRATVAVPMAGTYLVKIGSEVRKVNVR